MIVHKEKNNWLDVNTFTLQMKRVRQSDCMYFSKSVDLSSVIFLIQ